MKERFEGEDGARRMSEAFRQQKAALGDQTLAEDLCQASELVELEVGKAFITEGTGDSDIFFILLGEVAVIVKGKTVATRKAGEHVGEMAAIDPAQPRSATCIATVPTVVGRVTEAKLSAIALKHPSLWRSLAVELSRRLAQRNALVRTSNERPVVFLISSKEALPLAYEIQGLLQHDALIRVWTNDVFRVSQYPIESLEEALAEADFAIAIAQPDDVVTSRTATQGAPRDNVIFELGFFMGHLGRTRTMLLEPAGTDQKLPSDMKGLMSVHYKTGSTKDQSALLSPACTEIRKHIQKHGVRTS
jgi:CRP/FNR family cyclic AMP-dependent transcriptional regulator